MSEKCTWTYDENDDSWDATCGAAWYLIEGGPKYNGMLYCPECGKELVEAEQEADHDRD